MSRKQNLDRPIRLHTTIPTSIRAKLDLHLFSEVEGRVPMGAYQEFFLERIKEFFDDTTVEISPGKFVRGSKEAMDELQERLNGSTKS